MQILQAFQGLTSGAPLSRFPQIHRFADRRVSSPSVAVESANPSANSAAVESRHAAAAASPLGRAGGGRWPFDQFDQETVPGPIFLHKHPCFC